MRIQLLTVILCVWAQSVIAADEMDVIIIESDERTAIIKEATFKTEKLSEKRLKAASTQTLADAVSQQPGVDTQTYCANCGAKRLTINGLKGEHTSILIDGLPLHSAVSSFYGVDNIPITGLSEVLVMRGAGASLVNPEAIGGTLDLITIDPLEKTHRFNAAFGVRDGSQYRSNDIKSSENYSFLVTRPFSKRSGLSIGGQYGYLNYWDEDDNLVAEAPERKNASAFLKYRIIPTKRDDISIRFGYSELEIIGGNTVSFIPSEISSAEPNGTDFVDGDVRNRYTGAPNRVTDYIELTRYEGALHWTHFINSKWTVDWNTGYARQEQRSIYQHGFDYANNDDLLVTDLSTQYLASDSHLLKFGLFYKLQDLRSTSLQLFTPISSGGLFGLPKDNFNNQSYAGYFQHTYLVSDHLTIESALRLDSIHLQWEELTTEINELVVAPRVQIKHDITHHLSQRFSYGLGYRSPLTFFESQHGNNENGYVMNINKLEKAHSFVYSLSQNTPDYYVTLSTHYTLLQNMAFGLEDDTPPANTPTSYINSDEDFDIWVSDILGGVRITPWWFVEAAYEVFVYEDEYKDRLPTAAIENRIRLTSEMEWKNYDLNVTTVYVGDRDISKYGFYTDHFNRLQGSTFSQPKNARSPEYFVVDASLTYKNWKPFRLTFGVNNIFDETQARRGDSPTMWHNHVGDAHFDNLHTWGPNRGREYYLQVTSEF